MAESSGRWKKYGLNNKSLFKIMSNQLAKLLFKVLKAYGISITYPTIERVVNSHPAYPSMQCVSDAFDSWKVKHVALKLSTEELRALNIPVNTAGCNISYSLIKQEKQQSNRFIRLFCFAGTQIDCNQVTKSLYSKLFGLISWAEVGMAYFSAVILSNAIMAAEPQHPFIKRIIDQLPVIKSEAKDMERKLEKAVAVHYFFGMWL
jgi:hypothetical protein